MPATPQADALPASPSNNDRRDPHPPHGGTPDVRSAPVRASMGPPHGETANATLTASNETPPDGEAPDAAGGGPGAPLGSHMTSPSHASDSFPKLLGFLQDQWDVVGDVRTMFLLQFSERPSAAGVLAILKLLACQREMFDELSHLYRRARNAHPLVALLEKHLALHRLEGLDATALAHLLRLSLTAPATGCVEIDGKMRDLLTEMGVRLPDSFNVAAAAAEAAEEATEADADPDLDTDAARGAPDGGRGWGETGTGSVSDRSRGGRGRGRGRGGGRSHRRSRDDDGDGDRDRGWFDGGGVAAGGGLFDTLPDADPSAWPFARYERPWSDVTLAIWRQFNPGKAPPAWAGRS